MSAEVQRCSDVGLDSIRVPERIWTRVAALGIDIWSRDGDAEFTRITVGIADDVGLRLHLIPRDNCDISFGFDFRDTGEPKLPPAPGSAAEALVPVHSFQDLEALISQGEPLSKEHAQSWQQDIDAARTHSANGYVRVSIWGARIFKALLHDLGLEYQTNTYPEIWDSQGIVIGINPNLGLHIARFQEGQTLSARIVDLSKPVF